MSVLAKSLYCAYEERHQVNQALSSRPWSNKLTKSEASLLVQHGFWMQSQERQAIVIFWSLYW